MPKDTQKKEPEKPNRMFNRLISALEDNFLLVWIITKGTLSVVLLALIALSPMFIWPMLMAWPIPYCYIAFAIWIAYFGTVVIIAAVFAYIRESKGAK